MDHWKKLLFKIYVNGIEPPGASRSISFQAMGHIDTIQGCWVWKIIIFGSSAVCLHSSVCLLLFILWHMCSLMQYEVAGNEILILFSWQLFVYFKTVCLLLVNRTYGRNTWIAGRVIIALAKNAGCLQNGSHLLLSLLASFEKQVWNKISPSQQ